MFFAIRRWYQLPAAAVAVRTWKRLLFHPLLGWPDGPDKAVSLAVFLLPADGSGILCLPISGIFYEKMFTVGLSEKANHISRIPGVYRTGRCNCSISTDSMLPFLPFLPFPRNGKRNSKKQINSKEFLWKKPLFLAVFFIFAYICRNGRNGRFTNPVFPTCRSMPVDTDLHIVQRFKLQPMTGEETA